MSRLSLTLAVAIIVACGQRPPAEPPAKSDAAANANVADRDWVLVELGDKKAPFGAQLKPPTLKLSQADSRATGFAGCNRYFATYSLSGDSLKFQSPGATKMFCAAADTLERAFLGMLPEVTTYQVSDTVLTLTTKSGLLARFHAAR